MQIPERPDDRVLGHLDAELDRLAEAADDIERHVGRRRPARPPGEGPERRLGLEELPQRRLPLRLGHPRVEHLLDPQARVLAAPGGLEPGRLFEGHLPVRVGPVERLVDRVALAQFLGHAPDLRIFRVEAGQDARREEPVERLLRALVGVVDQIGEGLEQAVEELGVDRDHELLVDAGRIVGLGHILEPELAGLPFLERREARLDEMHPARQDRQRPKLPVGKRPALGHDLERDRPHPGRRGQREDDRHPAARLDLERPGRHRRRKPESRGQVLARRGVGDLERHLAGERRRARVVDHHPQLGRVALAEKARQVRPDHEVLDALRLRLERPALEVPRHAVDEDAPTRDRIGHGELDRGRPVGARQQVGLPEGRLREIRPELRSRLTGRFLAGRRGRGAALFLHLARRHRLVHRGLPGHRRARPPRSRPRPGRRRRLLRRPRRGDPAPRCRSR